MLARALGVGTGLNPLAHASTLVHGLDEADGAIGDVGSVVAAHDRLDGLGGLIGIVEGDRAHVVMQDVGLDDAVEDVAADEAKLTIDRGSSPASEVPGLTGVVRKGGIGVLEVGDRD